LSSLLLSPLLLLKLLMDALASSSSFLFCLAS